jgi:hypothetical protein
MSDEKKQKKNRASILNDNNWPATQERASSEMPHQKMKADEN